jgi:hypothetical protein
MYWLLGRKSKLSTSNKLLIYKTILKPIWTYGIQPWGTASTSKIEILERFQSKALRMIVDGASTMVVLVCAEYDYPKGSPDTNSQRRNPPLQLSIQCSPQRTSERPSSEPHGGNRQHPIAKTPAK